MFFFESLDHDVSAPHLPQIWRRGLAFVAQVESLRYIADCVIEGRGRLRICICPLSV
jgi:hypothetical protein